MHKVILLLSCDSCGRLLHRTSVCEQADAVNWETAVTKLEREVSLEFELLRRQARRSGWDCEDPCMLCFECSGGEVRFLEILAERLQEGGRDG